MTPRAPGILKSPFGGDTRAQDGVIATLELDGERFCIHRSQVIHSHGLYRGIAARAYWRRSVKTPKESSVQQIIDYCDKTGAKIVCLSTPDTILRDLQGTRAELEIRPGKKNMSEEIHYPEKAMLGKRLDLLLNRGYGSDGV